MHTVLVSAGNTGVSLLQTKLCNAPFERREEVGVVPFPLPSSVNSITSPSNPFVKHCVKLRQSSSYRHSHGCALIVGTTPLREITRFEGLIEDKHSLFHCLLLLDSAEAPKELRESSIRIVRVSSMIMRKLSGLQSTDSIEAAALLKIPKYHHMDGNHGPEDFRNWFPSPHRILVLDGIQDPGNLGTLLRSAVAFRWDGVFLLPGCCDPFNEKALRASRGASFQLPIVSGNWAQLETLRSNHQIKMLAGHPESKVGTKGSVSVSHELSDSLVDTNVCLVLGSEGQGLSEQSEEVCEFISIPMAGGYESLNVSVAGGIFLYMLQPKNHKLI